MSTREELENAIEKAKADWNVNTHSAADAAWDALDTAWKALKVYDKENTYKNMFEQSVLALAAIDDALGIGDDGCSDTENTLYAIAELKAAAARGGALTLSVMSDNVGKG
jgi:hypothetical protein